MAKHVSPEFVKALKQEARARKKLKAAQKAMKKKLEEAKRKKEIIKKAKALKTKGVVLLDPDMFKISPPSRRQGWGKRPEKDSVVELKTPSAYTMTFWKDALRHLRQRNYVFQTIDPRFKLSADVDSTFLNILRNHPSPRLFMAGRTALRKAAAGRPGVWPNCTFGARYKIWAQNPRKFHLDGVSSILLSSGFPVEATASVGYFLCWDGDGKIVDYTNDHTLCGLPFEFGIWSDSCYIEPDGGLVRDISKLPPKVMAVISGNNSRGLVDRLQMIRRKPEPCREPRFFGWHPGSRAAKIGDKFDISKWGMDSINAMGYDTHTRKYLLFNGRAGTKLAYIFSEGKQRFLVVHWSDFAEPVRRGFSTVAGPSKHIGTSIFSIPATVSSEDIENTLHFLQGIAGGIFPRDVEIEAFLRVLRASHLVPLGQLEENPLYRSFLDGSLDTVRHKSFAVREGSLISVFSPRYEEEPEPPYEEDQGIEYENNPVPIMEPGV